MMKAISIKMMFQTLPSWLVMFAICLPTLAVNKLEAQEKSPAETIAPYLDQDTLGVAWFDVERMDVLALAKMVSVYYLPVAESDLKYAEALLQGLKKQRVIKLYCVIDATTLMAGRPPLCILQTKADVDLSVVQASLTPFIEPTNLTLVKDGELLLMGSAKDLATTQKRPSVKLERLQKQMSLANRSNAVCIAPSPELSEALKVAFSLGADSTEAPFLAVRFLRLFAPMEGMRIDSSALPQGLDAVVDFDSSAKANDFKQALKAILTDVVPNQAGRLLPELKDTSAVWELEDPEKFDKFFGAMSAELAANANRTKSINNMKQLALALHNHHDSFSILPPQALASKEGTRLLSWRVLLLPLLGEADLYEKFKLDEPWDSPHNAALIKEMPACFARPGTDPTLGKTPYLTPLTKESVFGRPGLPPRFQEILDGTSNTIWLVEVPAEFEVAWTKPADWEVTGVEAIDSLRRGQTELKISLMDGSVQTLPTTIASEIILKMFTIAGGEVTELK